MIYIAILDKLTKYLLYINTKNVSKYVFISIHKCIRWEKYFFFYNQRWLYQKTYTHYIQVVILFMLPAINKKRMAEEKKLSQGLEKYTVLRRDHVHKKEDVSVKIYIHHFYNESFQVLYISSSLQMRYKISLLLRICILHFSCLQLKIFNCHSCWMFILIHLKWRCLYGFPVSSFF